MNTNIEVLRGLVAGLRELADEARAAYSGQHASGTFRAVVQKADELDAALAAMGGEGEVVDCEDCGGGGVTGNVYPGSDFQPPEPEACPSCGGSGKWRLPATHHPAPQQPEAQAGGAVVCSICEELVEKIEAGYVPRGHGVYSKPFTPPPSAVPEGWRLVRLPNGNMKLTKNEIGDYSKIEVREGHLLYEFFSAMLAAAPEPKEA